MSDSSFALVLTGGGARAAYQVGFLRYVASRYPNFSPAILTGVSAGGIIATDLAACEGRFVDAVEELAELWRSLRMQDVFYVNTAELSSRVARWGMRLMSGGALGTPHARSLVDTSPLRQLLVRSLHARPDGTIPGLAANLAAGRVDAVALTASSYFSGQSVTWVQKREGCGLLTWEHPKHQGNAKSLGVDHVMASSALPFFFPAVQVEGTWYGDGGIRLTAPLAPAVHLGARKIIAVSTRYPQPSMEIDRTGAQAYPPPAQVAGVLLNAIFLDLLDADAQRLAQINSLVDRLPHGSRGGLRHIDLLVLRPSQDLGRLANEFEFALPRSVRFLVRGLGTREARSNDMLSLLMFQQDYIARLIALGEADARARGAEIDAFMADEERATGTEAYTRR
jgi:NTE family protein